MSYSAAVITVSDKGYAGERVDTSGPALCDALQGAGLTVEHTAVVPDDYEMIKAELLRCADELHVSLVLTTGGTGFSPRDITPEVTREIIERETPGIPETMRAESMRITPRGCLSRSVAGIRKSTLIVNLPGSKKAAIENLQAVLPALIHGLDMLASQGSANCAESLPSDAKTALVSYDENGKAPSMDAWLKEAKADPSAGNVGMYLVHNGVVRRSARVVVRDGKQGVPDVCEMEFSFDAQKVDEVIRETHEMDGVFYIRIWLNRGKLNVGDDIMYVLVGGDTRPHVLDALTSLVGKIKSSCVIEKEILQEAQ